MIADNGAVSLFRGGELLSHTTRSLTVAASMSVSVSTAGFMDGGCSTLLIRTHRSPVAGRSGHMRFCEGSAHSLKSACRRVLSNRSAASRDPRARPVHPVRWTRCTLRFSRDAQSTASLYSLRFARAARPHDPFIIIFATQHDSTAVGPSPDRGRAAVESCCRRNCVI